MRIATWNVNSLRSRIDRVEALLQRHEIDVLALQETKAREDQLPLMGLASLGYDVAAAGVDQWNGVAILSRVGIAEVVTGFPGMPGWGDPLARDPELVVRDVVWGKVSAGAALRDYGVVLTGSRDGGDLGFDAAATESERAGRASWSREDDAFFDRGPVDAPPLIDAGPGGATAQPSRGTIGGSWGAYYYNGLIISSEMARGLDILELTPSGYLSQCEIDAANTVELEYFNPQGQPRFEWPASFVLARAYLDQLERSNGLAAARITAVRADLDGAEKLAGAPRQQALKKLSSQVTTDATRATDRVKTRMLADAVRELVAMR